MCSRSLCFAAAVVVLGCPAFGQDKARQYTNPLGEKPIHLGDPFLFRHADKYYLFGSAPDGEGFQVFESPDLLRWKPKGWALKRAKNSWAGGDFRGPDVRLYKGRFYMVYSAAVRGSRPPRTLLGLAASDWPGGPYYDVQSRPWIDPGFSCAHGNLFIENDGAPYLFFTRTGEREGYTYGAVYGARLAGDLSNVAGTFVPLLEPGGQPWEKADWRAYRSNEGPTVIAHDGRYYMTYCANSPVSSGSGIGYATAPAPLGPWTKAPENPVLSSSNDLKVSGPAHNSLFRSPDQTEWFIVYQAHDPAPAGSNNPPERVVNIDRVIFDANGRLVVKGPTRSPQPLPSALTVD